MKQFNKILIYSFFLILGIFLFWRLYRNLDLNKLRQGLIITNYYWIVVSIVLGLFSQYIRAIRWKMLIKPLGYNPRVSNIFYSVLIMYCTNLLVPRAGEVARCTVLAGYEKIPISKLIGTVIVERIADILTMLVLFLFILIINIGIVREFLLNNPEIHTKLIHLLSITNIVIAIMVIALVIALFLVIKPFHHSRFGERLNKIKHGFTEGVKSILILDKRWYFILCTLFIFILWLFMLYVVFLAFPPTKHLSIEAGMFTFLMGGLAMLAPVQAGIGAWHFMVIKSLDLYGISEQNGLIFALVAHTSTNLVYLVFGLAAFIILPVINKTKKNVTNE